MKKEALFLTIFLSGCVVQASPFRNDTTRISDKDARVRRLYSSYTASLLLSGCIGASTGSAVRYLEKRFDVENSPIALFLFLLSWVLESELRNDLVAAMQKDLDSYAIGHKKNLMFKAAWIASWIAYLKM